MALVNFTNFNGKIIPCKSLYIVDKDHNLQEIKYQRIEDWWNQLFIENINIKLGSTPVLTMINDNTSSLPQKYLQILKNDHFAVQPKAVYIVDNNGNIIEFINEIKKPWSDFLLGNNINFTFFEDISNMQENLDLSVSSSLNDSSDSEDFNFIEDISINAVSEINLNLGNGLDDDVGITLTPV